MIIDKVASQHGDRGRRDDAVGDVFGCYATKGELGVVRGLNEF